MFFLSDDGHVMAAAAIPGPIPAFEAPTPLFQGLPRSPPYYAVRFSVSEDGQRFLLAESNGGDDEAGNPLTVLVNWTIALRRK